MSSIIKVGKVQSSTGQDAVTVADSGAITANGALTATGALTASGGIANAGTISAGTLGSSVVVPASVGSSLVFLEKYTADNSASAKIFNLDSYTSYNSYQFILDHLLPSADNVTFEAHLGTASDTFESSNNSYTFGSMFQYYRYSDGDNGRTSENTHARALMLPYVGNDSGCGVTGIINLFGATNSSQRTYTNHRISMWQLNNYGQFHSGGSIKTSATDDAYIRFKFNSGDLFSGTIALYGVKDA
jgi:hypothetical protein